MTTPDGEPRGPMGRTSEDQYAMAAGGTWWRAQAWRAERVLLALALPLACAPATPIRRPSLPPADGPAIDPGTEPAISAVARESPTVRQFQADAIRRGLAVLSPTVAASVDVRVGPDGTAVLRGEVPNQRLRRQAEENARAVEGVVQVVNQVRVFAPLSSDKEVAANVMAALGAEAALADAVLTVQVDQGLATLRGHLPSGNLAALAEDIAAAVAGVRDVASEIWIPDPLSPPSDWVLERQLKETLAGVAHEGTVQVDVEARVVGLRGRVKSFAVREELLSRAWLPGVRSVRAHDLRVFWRQSPVEMAARERSSSDSTIEAHLVGAIRARPRLSQAPIRVRVRKGVAHLTGTVASLQARGAAERAAALTSGVRAVNNELDVRAPPGNGQLVTAVVAALARDPYLDHRTLQVRARAGHVHLQGRVDAPFELERAAQVTSQVAGVTRVTNAIELAPIQGR